MNATRREIIKEFCKSVAWIDDEILPPSACDPLLAEKELISKHFSFFAKEAELLHKNGMLCSLIPFEAENSYNDDEGAISQCASLAASADAIILDWQLGKHNDYSCCLKIIQKILQLDGIRYIVILSNFVDKIPHILKEEIENLNESDSSEWYTDNNGKYITITEKGSKSLSDVLFERLVRFSDSLLTWVAIEITNIIKKIIPSLIKSTPNDADAGFLLDYYLSGKKAFTADTIVCNMLEDINFSVKDTELSSLSSKVLDNQNSIAFKLMETALKDYCSATTSQELKQSIITQLAQKIISNSQDICFNKYVKFLRDDFTQNYNDLKNIFTNTQTLQEFIKSIVSYTSYCEALCIKPDSSASNVKRGNIYSSPDHADSLFVCVSQACDAEHKKDIFLLQANPVKLCDTQTKNMIFFACNSILYSIMLSPASLSLNKKSLFSGQDPKFKLVGYLRGDTIDSISNKFWSHMTRVGVNLPCIDRALRI